MPPVCGQFKNVPTSPPGRRPSSGPPAVIEDPFDIASMPNGLPCVTQPQDRSFAPGFEAGATSTQAGAGTNFVLNVARRDGEQELARPQPQDAPRPHRQPLRHPLLPRFHDRRDPITIGLAETNSPSCPAASQIGTIGALAGPGRNAALHRGPPLPRRPL